MRWHIQQMGTADFHSGTYPPPSYLQQRNSISPAQVNNVQAPCCRRQLSSQPYVFEKPEKKTGQLLSTTSIELVSPRLPQSPLSYSALSSDICLALKASTL